MPFQHLLTFACLDGPEADRAIRSASQKLVPLWKKSDHLRSSFKMILPNQSIRSNRAQSGVVVGIDRKHLESVWGERAGNDMIQMA